MFGGKGGGASHLALGFSDILYLASFTGLGEVWGEGERGWACYRYGITSPSPGRGLLTVTYCVPTYLFVVNI